jgi:hypothetical protein
MEQSIDLGGIIGSLFGSGGASTPALDLWQEREPWRTSVTI